MTDTCSAAPLADDIDEAGDSVSTRLSREADAILLADAQRPDVRPLRRAVREDAAQARDWGRDRAVRLRGAVRAEPVKSSLYALGLGVVIGLLIVR